MHISDFTVDEQLSIMEAMDKLNKNTKGIIYVTKGDLLYGVITDGDIRRYILKNGNLDEKVIKICNKKPHFLYTDNQEIAYDLMKKKKIRSVPIVDKKRKIVKIYFDDDITKEKRDNLNIPVVIMAGGKGTRLYPYTQILPKPLIPIGEKTITEHILGRFAEYGCNNFVMIVNYKKHFIMSYFEDNETNFNIDFVEEEEFLGTGGGLRLLEKKISSTFFMSNCDILIDADYSEMLKYHRAYHNLVTMICTVKKLTIPYGTVEMSEGNMANKLSEKPEFSFVTNTGLYLLEPEFIEMIPPNTFIHITDVIQKCIDDGKRVGVYLIDEKKWLDMGQLGELNEMVKKLT